MYARARVCVCVCVCVCVKLGPSWMFHNDKTDLVFLYADATESAPVISDKW